MPRREPLELLHAQIAEEAVAQADVRRVSIDSLGLNARTNRAWNSPSFLSESEMECGHGDEWPKPHCVFYGPRVRIWESAVLANKQKIYDVVSAHLQAREFSRSDLLDVIDKHYPGTNHGSILPSDYLRKDALKLDPSNDGNRNNYSTCPRFLERLGRNRYRFLGWDGLDEGALDAPLLRGPMDDQSVRRIAMNPVGEPLVSVELTF